MAAQDDNIAVIWRSRTSFADGMLIPDVVVERVTDDRLQVTQHPVESGAAISDHAYKMPITVDMEIGWADYKDGSTGGSVIQWLRLLSTQAKREPYTINTPKRIYRNMLPVQVTFADTHRTKHSIMARVRFQEIRITGVRNKQSGVGTNLQEPQSNAPPASRGNVQLQVIGQNNNPATGPRGTTQFVIPPPAPPA